MSRKSNDYGRAYEYFYLKTLFDEISKVRPVFIEENSSFFASKKAFETLSNDEKMIFKVSTYAAIEYLLKLEPYILDYSKEFLKLKIQTDNNGIEADVRDILIIRNDVNWEVGFSIKHNHFAVKHSRLSKNIDFGLKWYGLKCSQEYWNDVKPIFSFLEEEKNKKTKWSDIIKKEDSIYLPLLNAFKDEIIRQNQKNDSIPKLLVEYLLGKYDFYKVIGIDAKGITKIECYNLHGFLNKKNETNSSNIEIPIVKLPNKIIKIDFKKNSKNTLEIYFDEDWQFNFRIHNASSIVEPSLKFDIQIVKMPSSILNIDCIWNKNIC